MAAAQDISDDAFAALLGTRRGRGITDPEADWPIAEQVAELGPHADQLLELLERAAALTAAKLNDFTPDVVWVQASRRGHAAAADKPDLNRFLCAGYDRVDELSVLRSTELLDDRDNVQGTLDLACLAIVTQDYITPEDFSALTADAERLTGHTIHR